MDHLDVFICIYEKVQNTLPIHVKETFLNLGGGGVMYIRGLLFSAFWNSVKNDMEIDRKAKIYFI